MSLEWVKGWFHLSRREQWVVAGLAAIFLIGLAARHLYLRQETSRPVVIESSPS